MHNILWRYVQFLPQQEQTFLLLAYLTLVQLLSKSADSSSGDAKVNVQLSLFQEYTEQNKHLFHKIYHGTEYGPPQYKIRDAG